MRGDVEPLAGMTPVFLEPKPMPYLQHLSSHNNNNNVTAVSAEDNHHSGRDISPPNHATSLEDSKAHLANVPTSISSQTFYHHHEHEKYGLQ